MLLYNICKNVILNKPEMKNKENYKNYINFEYLYM